MACCIYRATCDDDGCTAVAIVAATDTGSVITSCGRQRAAVDGDSASIVAIAISASDTGAIVTALSCNSAAVNGHRAAVFIFVAADASLLLVHAVAVDVQRTRAEGLAIDIQGNTRWHM